MACLILSIPAAAQHLRVSDNQRYLVKADGTPFFYLGDTAWELFHRLNREEADMYLKDRAEKGFTVIQAVALAEINGLRDPNPYGHLPLHNEDPTKPNDAYFQHVDYIVNKAAELGLTIGMLPTWGDKIFKNSWGVGPEIFTPENARVYGEYIGRRYKDKPIIWVLGGDRLPRHEQDEAIWRAMAEGIVAGAGDGDADNVMMTFHPQPKEDGGSSTWFHNDPWLDFNMFQTGHCRDVQVYEKITHDYNLKPVKPTMDGEPIYEEHPMCFNAKEKGYTAAWDVRRAAYQDLFAGAHGHTYGCHNIWQMYDTNREGINGPTKTWKESLDLPGARQMTFVRALIESRPFLVRMPDQQLVQEAYAGTERIQATRGEDYAFIYSTAGKPIEVNMGIISGKQVNASWYNPRTGTSTFIGKFKNTGSRTFTPPTSGPDNDWVLLLDDVNKGYKPPQHTKP
ncbi:glycoside hydrolase family 140 protein [Pontibacter saemangeumensis]|uniref:Glycoside hydrolase family 140 protein n=1 Tax=Pontibacter saemangeumensis TaxID=1084525 RepID=A0ABP8LL54_9BACT